MSNTEVASTIDADVRTDRTIRDRLRHLSLKGFLDVSEVNEGLSGGSRRALGYRLEQIGLDVPDEDVRRVIRQWKTLKPYPDVDAALDRLSDEYELVGLSNGDPDMLEAVRPNFETDLDGIVSVADAGAYKPHRASYDLCCERFDVAPHEVLFVTAHTFDLVGAKAIGMRGAFLNRHENPYGGWIYHPDTTAPDTDALADMLTE